MPLGKRRIRSRNLQLARAETDPAAAGRGRRARRSSVGLRRRSRTHILLALCTAAGLVAQQPQATIRITVESDGAPLAGANVQSSGTTAQTNRTGVAVVPVALGNVEIRVTKDGFLPGKTNVSVDEAREWQVEIELERERVVEEQITVHATRTDVRLQDSPTRVEVLGAEEIDEKTLMTPGDIVMMLNEMGGLRVQSTSPSLGAASVRIQGMRGRYTRFLTDGLPLFGQQGAGLGLLQVPPMDLGQVEVIKGVSSALYGAGAMAGVVNLISRRPGAEPVYDVLFNRSTRGATDGGLFLASPLSSHWSGSFLGGGHFQQRNDIDGDGWADLAGYSRGVARPRLFWDSGDGRTAFLTGGLTYENREGGSMPGAVLPVTGSPYIEALDTHRYDLGGSFAATLRSRYVIAARFAASSQHHDHRFGEARERDRHEMVFGELTLRGTWGRHTWVAGTALEREAYRPRDVPRFAYRYLTPGIFVQDDITAAPWISISASARADFQNRYGTFFSPRVSALIRLLGWTSRISAGQGFFAPTPLTEETEAAGLARLTLPAPLVPERGRSASFDLSRTLGPLSYTATLFASRISHPVFVERTDRYAIVNLAGPARNAGVELLATWRKAPFSATASYTYVRSTEPENGLRVETALTPRQSFGVVGSWENRVWHFGVETYYTGRQRLEDNPYRSESRPYELAGFLAERSLGRLRLFLNAENLTGVRQTRWDSLLRPTRGADGRWTVDAWAPLDGRVFNGGLRVRF
ncbi:MAG: TonB-dependent receptor [Terriglobia bacterium]|nr:MAG: TonB-dependent receptor [Terriglobia bacterium]